MAGTEISEELLAELTAAIVSAVRPERVVVFGSVARGDATEDSDLDLLVQVETGRSTAEASRLAYAAIRPLRSRLMRGVDVLVRDSRFVKRYGGLVGTVVGPALEEGKVLYER